MGIGPRIISRAPNAQATIQVTRPKFQDVWSSYPVGMSAPVVYEMVGGEAYELYKTNPQGYANACALRLSRALNYAGMPIQKNTTGYKVRGADTRLYLLRVKDMINHVFSSLGKPDQVISPKSGEDTSSQFAGKNGILIFKVSGWGDATGHVTVWNGADCGDHCYFIHSQPNVNTTEVMFWELK